MGFNLGNVHYCGVSDVSQVYMLPASFLPNVLKVALL